MVSSTLSTLWYEHNWIHEINLGNVTTTTTTTTLFRSAIVCSAGWQCLLSVSFIDWILSFMIGQLKSVFGQWEKSPESITNFIINWRLHILQAGQCHACLAHPQYRPQFPLQGRSLSWSAQNKYNYSLLIINQYWHWNPLKCSYSCHWRTQLNIDALLQQTAIWLDERGP